jgi:response regulator RpfG family c-di-GMP phosphodiesterase/signal transduction histidine kinase
MNEMVNENEFNESEHRRKLFLNDAKFALVASSICFLLVFIGKFLLITTYSYTQIFILIAIASFICIINFAIGLKKRKFTKQFNRKLLFINYFYNTFFMGVAIYFFQNFRVLILVFIFVANTIMLPNLKIKSSLIQIFSTSLMYFSISYYCIKYLNQGGDIKFEFFSVMTYILVSIFIILIGVYSKRIRDKIKIDKIEIEARAEKLKELDKIKTNFFTNISHELRTPLTLILGPLESIISGEYGKQFKNDDEKFKSMFSNSTRLLKLINNLLDFSKIEAGKMSVNLKKTDMAELLKYFTATIKSGAESRKLQIVFNDNTDGVIAYIDRDLIEKAVYNLISNALKFTPEGGNVILQLDSTDENFSISVKDTGIGIPEDKLEAIFERFSQVDGSSYRKYEGTGIGLAFAKEIAELHNGKISVKSKLGSGSTFTITLPFGKSDGREMDDELEDIQEVKSYLLSDMQIKAEDADKAEISQANDKDKMNILFVDDTLDMRKFVYSLLENEYNITTAVNGKDGLEKALKIKPDIILSDVMMPEMDGYELTKLIKADETLKGIPVILLTAKADVAMKIEGLEVGADDYLSKPFNSKELKARIKSQLKMKSLRDVLSDKKKLLEELVKEQTKTIEQDRNEAVMLKERAEKQLEDFLMVLASAIESKDAYTGGHVERVANYARDLAEKVGIDGENLRSLYLGAMVHDVGKIGVPDQILNKPGKLEPEEMKEMQNHAIIGKRLLSKIEGIDIASTIAFSHQEKYDGTGYPQGLIKNEISLEARIVTIADYWDAIITDRPYRKAMPLKKAISIMKEEGGKAFDPELFNLFMNDQDKLYLKYVDKEKLKELEEAD